MNSARLRRYRIFTFVGAMLILLHVGISCLLKRGLGFGGSGFLSLPIITCPVDFTRVFQVGGLPFAFRTLLSGVGNPFQTRLGPEPATFGLLAVLSICVVVLAYVAQLNYLRRVIVVV